MKLTNCYLRDDAYTIEADFVEKISNVLLHPLRTALGETYLVTTSFTPEFELTETVNIVVRVASAIFTLVIAPITLFALWLLPKSESYLHLGRALEKQLAADAESTASVESAPHTPMGTNASRMHELTFSPATPDIQQRRRTSMVHDFNAQQAKIQLAELGVFLAKPPTDPNASMSDVGVENQNSSILNRQLFAYNERMADDPRDPPTEFLPRLSQCTGFREPLPLPNGYVQQRLSEGKYYSVSVLIGDRDQYPLEEYERDPSNTETVAVVMKLDGEIKLFFDGDENLAWEVGGEAILNSTEMRIGNKGRVIPPKAHLFNGSTYVGSFTEQQVISYPQPGAVDRLRRSDGFKLRVANDKQFAQDGEEARDGICRHPHSFETQGAFLPGYFVSKHKSSLEEGEKQFHAVYSPTDDQILKKVYEYLDQEFEMLGYTDDEKVLRLISFVDFILDTQEFKPSETRYALLGEFIAGGGATSHVRAMLFKVLAERYLPAEMQVSLVAAQTREFTFDESGDEGEFAWNVLRQGEKTEIIDVSRGVRFDPKKLPGDATQQAATKAYYGLND